MIGAETATLLTLFKRLTSALNLRTVLEQRPSQSHLGHGSIMLFRDFLDPSENTVSSMYAWAITFTFAIPLDDLCSAGLCTQIGVRPQEMVTGGSGAFLSTNGTSDSAAGQRTPRNRADAKMLHRISQSVLG